MMNRSMSPIEQESTKNEIAPPIRAEIRRGEHIRISADTSLSNCVEFSNDLSLPPINTKAEPSKDLKQQLLNMKRA